MRTTAKSTPQTTPRELPMNLQAFMTAPPAPVDPIREIQQMYNVDRETAFEIYEMVGERYVNEDTVASFCGIATPSYLEKLKGGVS